LHYVWCDLAMLHNYYDLVIVDFNKTEKFQSFKMESAL
jgi:hypothetical protein